MQEVGKLPLEPLGKDKAIFNGINQFRHRGGDGNRRVVTDAHASIGNNKPKTCAQQRLQKKLTILLALLLVPKPGV